MEHEKRLLTTNEAAAVLSICRATLYKLLTNGTIRSVTIGKSRRVSPAAIADYVKGLEREQCRNEEDVERDQLATARTAPGT